MADLTPSCRSAPFHAGASDPVQEGRTPWTAAQCADLVSMLHTDACSVCSIFFLVLDGLLQHTRVSHKHLHSGRQDTTWQLHAD